MKVLTPSRMREIDQSAIEEYAIPEIILMENAGHAILETMRREGFLHRLAPLAPLGTPSISILCGVGNNGGDGFVLARLLASKGIENQVLLFGDEKRLKETARKEYEILSSLKIPVKKNLTPEELDSALFQTEILVDALLGTGSRGELRSPFSEMIPVINRQKKPILSVDIPSGIDGETGEFLDSKIGSIRANATISLGVPKRGNLLYPGYPSNGKLYVSSISLPRDLLESPSLKTQINLPHPLPRRDPMGHKKSFPRVLIVAGSGAFRGAGAFSALAALRSGAGFVTLALPSSLISSTTPLVPEAIFHGLPESSNGTLDERGAQEILSLSQEHDIVLIGPGLSRERETVRLIQGVVNQIEKPLLLDADGLFCVAENSSLVRDRTQTTILTPHLGEQRRLQENKSQEIEKEYRSIVVYKGPHSQIRSPERDVFINLTGNDGLASAGTGDVLAGMIASLAISCETPLEGVKLAVMLHGLAADRWRESRGSESLVARDILDLLPETFDYYTQKRETLLETFFGKITSL